MSANENTRSRVTSTPMLALVRRELLAQMRTRRMFYGVLVLTILGAWIVLGQWPSSQNFVWRTMIYRAESLFTTLSVLSLSLAAVIVGGVASSSFVGEREQGSWDLLRLSLITRAGLVFGKLLSPMAVLLLTMIALGPIFAALLFLAGVDPMRVLYSAVIVGCTALTCSGIAIACSVRARTVVGGATSTFVAIATFMGMHSLIAWVILSLIEEITGSFFASFESELVFFFSPYWALAMAFEATSFSGLLPMGLHLAYQFVLFGITILAAAYSLGRDIESAATDRRSPRRKRKRTRAQQTDAGPGYGAIADRSNPVFRRELRWSSPFAGRGIRVVAALVGMLGFALFAGVSYLVSRESSLGDERILIVLLPGLFTFGALGCIYMPMACAGMYTREISEATYDMLRMTLLTPTQIVVGKFCAMLRHAAIVWLFAVVVCFPSVFWAIEDVSAVALLLISYVTLYVCLVYSGTAALFVSFASRKTGGAIVGSYFLVLFMFFGIFTIGLLFAETIGARTSESSVAFGLSVMSSPAIAFFWFVVDGFSNSNDDQIYYWIGSMVWVAVFALATQGWMVKRFRVRVEKVAE